MAVAAAAASFACLLLFSGDDVDVLVVGACDLRHRAHRCSAGSGGQLDNRTGVIDWTANRDRIDAARWQGRAIEANRGWAGGRSRSRSLDLLNMVDYAGKQARRATSPDDLPTNAINLLFLFSRVYFSATDVGW